MIRSIDELMAIAHHFHPRGISPSAPGYDDTEEHRRLVAARRRAGTENHAWRAMLARLRALSPGKTVQDRSLHLTTGEADACYSALLWLRLDEATAVREKNAALGILVSFLAPCYVVYQTSYVAVDPVGGAPSWHEQIRFTFSPREQPVAHAVVQEIEASFPGYESMPREIGDIIVPDLAAGFRSLGEARLFDLLFTDDW